MTELRTPVRPVEAQERDVPLTAPADPPAAPRWPLERVLFALAGSVTLVSALLAGFVSPWFLLLTAFVGINQWIYVAVHSCPASLLLGRYTEAQCRW